MFDLIFYEDKHGYCDVLEFIKDLEDKSNYSKDARIVRNKVIAYLDILEEMGTQVGMPVTRKLDKEIWELRPLSIRIMYASLQGNQYLLLHHFVKKTQKTPKHEMELARRQLADWTRRNRKL